MRWSKKAERELRKFIDNPDEEVSFIRLLAVSAILLLLILLVVSFDIIMIKKVYGLDIKEMLANLQGKAQSVTEAQPRDSISTASITFSPLTPAILFDKDSYWLGDRPLIIVQRRHVDSVTVKIWSTSDTKGISVSLMGNSSGVFVKQIAFTRSGKSAADLLEVTPGDSITAEYSYSEAGEVSELFASARVGG